MAAAPLSGPHKEFMASTVAPLIGMKSWASAHRLRARRREGADSRLIQEMLELPPGAHLCLIYERDPGEQLPALIPFIAQGLAQGEQFIYIADDQTIDQLSGQLQDHGIDVRHASASGALKLWTREQWRQPGPLDSVRKAAQVRQIIDAARTRFRGIRIAAEMTWTLAPDIDATQLEHWEATLNTITRSDFPVRMLCQYNRSRLPADVVLAALHTHPVVILGELVCPNFFYDAPMILRGHRQRVDRASAAVRATWMISQLTQYRMATLEREALFRERARRETGELREQSQRELLERRRADDADRRLAAIVESSDDAIVSKDLNGTILSWNKGAQRILGYTAAEVIGKSVTLLIPPDRQGEEQSILSRLRRGEPIDHYETVRIRKDGVPINVSLTVSPVKDADGRVVGASKIARDITQQKNADAALRAAQAELQAHAELLERRVDERTASLQEAIAQMEEFSASVSHDLRAPLRAIHTYAQILREEFGTRLDDTGRDYLRRIEHNSERMESLTRDILTYSRVARTDVTLNTVDLDHLLDDILAQHIQLQPPAANVEIHRPLLAVRGHEASLGQCLFNLLTNAVKFIAPGTVPHVSVRTEANGDCVRIWVEDNGVGIPPELHSRLFQVFERLHQRDHYEGTGIGLAIVRKAMEKMSGHYGVESDGRHGSRFWLELPHA